MKTRPLLLAALAVLPILGLACMYSGIVGGALVARSGGVPFVTFLSSVQRFVEPWDFVGGLIKAPVFGVIVAINTAIGQLTPPVGVCMFISCGIAKITMAQFTRECLIFIFALIGVLFLVTYLPGLILYLPGVLVVALASVTVAPIGARAANRMPVDKLRRVFALLLMSLAGYMAWKAFLD